MTRGREWGELNPTTHIHSDNKKQDTASPSPSPSPSPTHELWGKRAQGFKWKCGNFSHWPIATLVNAAFTLYKQGRLALMFTPQMLGRHSCVYEEGEESEGRASAKGEEEERRILITGREDWYSHVHWREGRKRRGMGEREEGKRGQRRREANRRFLTLLAPQPSLVHKS